MGKPLISIILPVYNGEDYLHKAIESCLNQTYRNLELIIVDDHSTDDTLTIAKSYLSTDNRVTLISNTVNKKLPASLNIGHEKAKGEYLTWTSHDNYYHPEAIHKLYEVIISQKVDVVYSNYLLIDANGSLIDYTNLKDLEYSFFYGVVGACFLYSREFFLRNEGYDEKLFLLEDFDFWLRGLKHGKFYKIYNPGFYYYRYHDNALTTLIKEDEEIKNNFKNRLTLVYDQLFKNCGIKNGRKLTNFFIHSYSDDKTTQMQPILDRNFLKDLSLALNDYVGISVQKLKRIIITDCIEITLRQKKFQTLLILYNFHMLAGRELLRIPMMRYFALVKKCLF